MENAGKQKEEKQVLRGQMELHCVACLVSCLSPMPFCDLPSGQRAHLSTLCAVTAQQPSVWIGEAFLNQAPQVLLSAFLIF